MTPRGRDPSRCRLCVTCSDISLYPGCCRSLALSSQFNSRPSLFCPQFSVSQLLPKGFQSAVQQVSLTGIHPGRTVSLSTPLALDPMELTRSGSSWSEPVGTSTYRCVGRFELVYTSVGRFELVYTGVGRCEPVIANVRRQRDRALDSEAGRKFVYYRASDASVIVRWTQHSEVLTETVSGGCRGRAERMI